MLTFDSSLLELYNGNGEQHSYHSSKLQLTLASTVLGFGPCQNSQPNFCLFKTIYVFGNGSSSSVRGEVGLSE
jgi:hypothetical protein